MSVDQVSRLSVLCNVLAWFFLSFLRNKMNISPFSYLDASSRQNGFQRTHKQTIHSEITGEFFLLYLRISSVLKETRALVIGVAEILNFKLVE